ncbi:protein grindelwald [Achroia grisella]|uniref:protein grindelwald n=1 Tax=Achroia grisella TaxID=688607 RepID=UPI0027D34DC4|nr:protein grindelwald [Achroia grisella]
MSQVVLQFLAVVGVASAQIIFDGVKCGDYKCNFDQYCSANTNQCASCNTACNQSHHNYEAGLCAEKCQGYLLDLRYVRNDGNTASPAGNDYNSIRRQAQAALIISVVSLAVLVLILIIICRGKFTWSYLKQKFQPKKNRVNIHANAGITHCNPHAQMATATKPDLKLEMRNAIPRTQPLNVRDLDARTQTEKSQGATTPKTVSTSLNNRHPAEDTTLDFSYDNRALNVLPSEESGENRF